MTRAKMHLSLNVRNVAASVRFYEAFFGAPVHKQKTNYANFDLEVPPLKLALQEIPELAASVPVSLEVPPVQMTGALSHLGILMETKAEVDAVRERLIASGLATFDEGDTICCYARQDKIWAHDPDGNGWEVYTLLEDFVEEKSAAPPTDAACCCEEIPATSGLLSLSLRKPPGR